MAASDQPSVAAWTNPYTRAVMPMVEVSAPARSKRPWLRSVSGSVVRPSTSRTRPIGTLTNSTQRHDAHSVSMPPAIRPTAAPPMDTAV